MHEQIILTDPPKRIIPIYEPKVLGPDRLECGQFSKRQRDWLLRRDTDPATGLVRCQFVGYSKKGEYIQCPIDERRAGGRSYLHAHHIVPQGFFEHWFGKRMGDEAENPNQPWNGIILCAQYHHNGKFGIHPDYAQALVDYRQGHHGSFKDVAGLHHELTLEGIPYWNTNFDRMLYEVALARTEEYLANHPDDAWPEDK